jgi:hypothetical protein
MRLNDAEAVQFFQKPFLAAFDPELRKGVWPTLRQDQNFNRRSRPATPFRPAATQASFGLNPQKSAAAKDDRSKKK